MTDYLNQAQPSIDMIQATLSRANEDRERHAVALAEALVEITRLKAAQAPPQYTDWPVDMIAASEGDTRTLSVTLDTLPPAGERVSVYLTDVFDPDFRDEAIMRINGLAEFRLFLSEAPPDGFDAATDGQTIPKVFVGEMDASVLRKRNDVEFTKTLTNGFKAGGIKFDWSVAPPVAPDLNPAPTPGPQVPLAGGIPAALWTLGPSTFAPWKRWGGDRRFNDVVASPVGQTWGDWFEGTGGRLFIDGGIFTASGNHRGQPFKGWSEYYFRGVTFDGLQWAMESNAGTKRGAIINVQFHDVREDAIRDVAGHIENVTIHSARLYPGSHGDTIDWKGPVDGAYIKNLRSLTGVLNGIITADVKNIVIDGYTHRGRPDHLSIDIGGDAENVVIRNCKLSGGIRFRGKQTNVHIDWATVQTNVKDWRRK